MKARHKELSSGTELDKEWLRAIERRIQSFRATLSYGAANSEPGARYSELEAAQSRLKVAHGHPKETERKSVRL